MAGKSHVESVSTIADWILLTLILTETVVSFPQKCPENKSLIRIFKTECNIAPIDEDYVKFCHFKRCVTVDVKKVLNIYPNLMLPLKIKGQRNLSKNLENFKANPSFMENINSDLDECCPTLRSFNPSEIMENIYGISRVIFQTDHLTQLIPTGQCLNHGKCGRCIIRNRTMSILVIDFTGNHHPPVEFDQFNVPLYCTCLKF